MEKKHWSLLMAVIGIAIIVVSSQLVAYENTSANDFLAEEMAAVMCIMQNRLENATPGSNFVYREEALLCLELLANTIFTGVVCTDGMTWNGLNYLYGEARNQKILYPELKDAFTKFQTHVHNHRAQLEKAGGKNGDPSTPQR